MIHPFHGYVYLLILIGIREEMESLGWDAPDFVYVCGDAYVDHPSFGAAIISRVLEDAGYRVAMLSQPDYRSAEDFCPHLVLSECLRKRGTHHLTV